MVFIWKHHHFPPGVSFFLLGGRIPGLITLFPALWSPITCRVSFQLALKFRVVVPFGCLLVWRSRNLQIWKFTFWPHNITYSIFIYADLAKTDMTPERQLKVYVLGANSVQCVSIWKFYLYPSGVSFFLLGGRIPGLTTLLPALWSPILCRVSFQLAWKIRFEVPSGCLLVWRSRNLHVWKFTF